LFSADVQNHTQFKQLCKYISKLRYDERKSGSQQRCDCTGNEDIGELEEAKYFLSFDYRIILVDGQNIHSYDELVKIVCQGKYRDQEFVEAVQMPAITGG
jgi:hypothetical protein